MGTVICAAISDCANDKKAARRLTRSLFVVGGKTGIRTLGTRKGTTVFETVPIDHSGIFPFSGCAKLRSFGEGDKFFDLFFSVLV